MVTAIDRRWFLTGAAALIAAPKSLAASAPQRVVTLEWTATEIALSLGILPVGCAEVDGYRTWVNVANGGLAQSIDVGTRQQPSLEAIRKLQPHLILSSRFRHASLESALADIAPVSLIDDQPANGDMLAAVYRSIEQAGAALGRADDAAGLLARFDNDMQMLKHKFADRIAGKKLLVAQPLPGVPRLRIFAPNSSVAALLGKIGFDGAMELSQQPFGFTTIDLEGLATLDGESTLIILADAIPDDLRSAALWLLLPVVAQSNVRLSGTPSWPFGSTASLRQLIGNIASQFS